MELENPILSCGGKSREAYNQIHTLTEDDQLSPIGQAVWLELGRYYEADPKADHVDWSIVKANLRRRAATDNQGEVFGHVIDLISGIDTSEYNLTSTLSDFLRDRVGLTLAKALLQKDHEGAGELVEGYVKAGRLEADTVESNVLCDVPLDAFFVATSNENKIPLSPSDLNDRTDGGVFRGNHIVLFGRPEVGKSAFCINLAAFLVNAGFRVLWCENEDPRWTVLKRFCSRLSGIPKADLYLRREEVFERLKNRGVERFIVADLAPGSRKEIQRLVERFQPDVVIINQLRNIRTRGASMEGRVNQLEQAALDARTVAKRNGVVVLSVTQAGDSGSGLDVLSASDIDNSKTGIPGQADLLIGLGGSAQTKERGMRCLSLCKNKLKENSTDVFFYVWYDPFIDRMESEIS